MVRVLYPIMIGFLIVVLAGCAPTPTTNPTTKRLPCDLGSIAGKWEGFVMVRSSGRQYQSTHTIKDDGTWESLIPVLANPGPRFAGTMTVEKGQCRWRSHTTGRVGTYVLQEIDGVRVLMMLTDDGISHSEFRPAK